MTLPRLSRGVKPAVTPVLVLIANADIPEHDIKSGDRVVIENLGEPDGMLQCRPRDTATCKALLTHPSVSVVPLSRARSADRRRQWHPSRQPLHLLKEEPDPTS